MEREIIIELINQAKEAANRNFCCKHTGFTVGAALMTKDGKVYKGFNIENAGIQSICGERVAFTKALSEGNKEFTCIAVMGKPITQDHFNKTLPCGYCRQFMTEYVPKDFMIYTYDDVEDKIYSFRLEDLLPESYIF